MSIRNNIVYNTINTFSTIVFPMITFPYVLRVLLPNNMGKINFSQNYVNYFSLLASLGVYTYAVRECSKVRNNRKMLCRIASQIFSINIVSMIVSLIVLIISCFLLNDRIASYNIIIGLYSINIVFDIIGTEWINVAAERFRFIAVRNFILQVIAAFMTFVLVRKQDDVIIYILLLCGTKWMSSLANIVYRRTFCDIRLTTELNLNMNLKPILMLFVMILAQTVFTSVDVTMLGFMRGDYDVGIYSTAMKMYTLIGQPIFSIAFVVLPRLSHYHKEGFEEAESSLLQKVCICSMVIGIPCGVGVILLAEEILFLLGGAPYSGAVLLLRILMLNLIVNLFTNIEGNMVLLPHNEEKYFTVSCCLTAVLNTAGNYYLIRLMGAAGACWMTFISSFVMLLLLHCKARRIIDLTNVARFAGIPVAGSAIMSILIIIIKKMSEHFILGVVSSVFFGAALYGMVANYLSQRLLDMNLFHLFKLKNENQ